MYLVELMIVANSFFFFFNQKTQYEMRISDWSSDVCSSDLGWLLKQRPPAQHRVAADSTAHGGRLLGTRLHHRLYRRAAALRLDPVRPAAERPLAGGHRGGAFRAARLCQRTPGQDAGDAPRWVDRKSTRLHSSH